MLTELSNKGVSSLHVLTIKVDSDSGSEWTPIASNFLLGSQIYWLFISKTKKGCRGINLIF